MKKDEYCIYNKYKRLIVYNGSYNSCLEYFNSQDKTFRKIHKIINIKDVK